MNAEGARVQAFGGGSSNTSSVDVAEGQQPALRVGELRLGKGDAAAEADDLAGRRDSPVSLVIARW
jgi:hypothetical protein